MDRTLFSPTMLDAYQACKRAYFLAYHQDGVEQVRSSAASICKRFILRGLSEINKGRLTSASQVQKFMGQYWPIDKLNRDPQAADAATRAFLFAYKTLLHYQAHPYLPDGAEIAAVSLKVRSRVQNERVYLEESFDLVLWYPREQKLELVIFNLKPVRAVDPAWPSPGLLVKQHLAERLKVRFNYKQLVVTNIKVSPQESKVVARDMSETAYRLHWPEIVKNLSEMKELVDMPEHEDPALTQNGCSYCQAIESRLHRNTRSYSGELLTLNAEDGHGFEQNQQDSASAHVVLEGPVSGGGYPLSA